MFSQGFSTGSFIRDSNLDRGISCSQHSYFLRGRSIESLGKPFQILSEREEQVLPELRRNSLEMNFTESISFLSLDRLSYPTPDTVPTEPKSVNSFAQVEGFMANLNISEGDLIRARKNLTKNWLSRIKHIVFERDLLAYHNHPQEVQRLKVDMEQCTNRIEQLSQLFQDRKWLTQYFETEVFDNGSFFSEVIDNPKLTPMGKYMLFESLPAFRFGIHHPEKFTSWNLKKLKTSNELFDIEANKEPLSHGLAMDLLRRSSQNDNEEDVPKKIRKEGSDNLTRYWAIAIVHLLNAHAQDLIKANTSKVFKNCLRLLKKCFSIPRLRSILERNPWLRRFLAEDESTHLLHVILTDKNIKKSSKKKLLETFPKLIESVRGAIKLSKWAKS